jgi:hypothetical protein
MAQREFLTAARLLMTMRRNGCEVTASDNLVNVNGPCSISQRALAEACKDELLEILAEEQQGSEGKPKSASATTLNPNYAPDSLLAMMGGGGQYVATEAWLRWHGRRIQAAANGWPFDEPAPPWALR